MAILAVDFQIFPRRFAKTETFGVSVMDIGVGTFIVSSAITSKYARGKEKVRSGSSAADRAAEGNSLMSRLSAYSLQHIMVLCLGVGRLVLLKVLNYQEHVSEYGVHWNFFVTLFSVWTAVDLLHAALPRQFTVFASLAALAAYQALLLCTPLTDYMMSDVREDIISANKEGIVSLLGYVPLYLLGEEISRTLFFPASATSAAVSAHEVPAAQTKASAVTKSGSPSSASGSPVESARPSSSTAAQVEGSHRSPPGWNLQLLNRLAFLSTAFWLGWWTATTFVQPTSRRLVNAAYVLLTLAIATAMILALYLVDTATARLGASPMLTLQYMSTHSLAVFLAANVMTGVVNMSMDTIHAPDELALSVLCCYALAVTCAAWAAESFLSPSQPSKLRT
jgi:phosphatidylinositol glycan class W